MAAAQADVTRRKWGILGTGNMAARMAVAITAMGGEVVAVGSRSNESARSFARRFGIRQAFDSYGALAMHREVEVVYIATTNDLHYANAKACLEQGRAVLCEKPLTPDSARTRDLIETARSLGVLLVEAMWMRFQPFIAVLDEIVQAKTVGRINYVNACFGFPVDAGPDSRWFNKRLGGGSLLDIGIYPLNLAHYLFGPPEQTQATLVHVPTGVDEQIAVCSRHRGGEVSLLTSSFRTATGSEAVVAGPRGRIRLHSPFHHCPRITVEVDGESKIQSYDTRYAGDGLELQVVEIHRCLDRSETVSPLMPHEDTLAVAEWMTRLHEDAGIRY